jgi:hypothetical protein
LYDTRIGDLNDREVCDARDRSPFRYRGRSSGLCPRRGYLLQRWHRVLLAHGQKGTDFKVAVHDYRPIGPDGEPFDDPFDVARVVLPCTTGNDTCPLCGSSDREEAEGMSDE